jgi:hypothetical protein
MRNLSFIILVLCLRSYASESEFNCHDIAIGSEGMAWDPNDRNQLISGVVVCESKSIRRQIQYKNGFKHGKEHITSTNHDGEIINTYSKGEKLMECKKTKRGEKTITYCQNFKTGEITQSLE